MAPYLCYCTDTTWPVTAYNRTLQFCGSIRPGAPGGLLNVTPLSLVLESGVDALNHPTYHVPLQYKWHVNLTSSDPRHCFWFPLASR